MGFVFGSSRIACTENPGASDIFRKCSRRSWSEAGEEKETNQTCPRFILMPAALGSSER